MRVNLSGIERVMCKLGINQEGRWNRYWKTLPVVVSLIATGCHTDMTESTSIGNRKTDVSDIHQLQDLFSRAPAKKYEGIVTESLYLTMRDGTKIAVDVLLPSGILPGVRLPVVLTMTRYWRSFELRIPNPPNLAPITPRKPLADDLVLRGFAMIIVDARGSGASKGVSRHPWTPEEIADYAEVAEWAVAQPWCNGSVGAVGISYEGTTAMLLPSTRIKSIKGVVSQQLEFDVYTDLAFPGGIFNEAFISAWHSSNENLDNNKLSELFPIPWYIKWILKGVRPVDSDNNSREILTQAIREHQSNTNVYSAASKISFRDDMFGNTGATLDDFSLFAHKKSIESSGSSLFTWGSWLDSATADMVVQTFNTFNNAQIGVIGAWGHEMTLHGSPYIGMKAKSNPTQNEQWASIAQFFDQTLKAGSAPKGKKLFYYTLGSETWKETDTFPLSNTKNQTWYFHSDNKLSIQPPNANVDTYKVNFKTTTGTNNRWHTGLIKPVVYPNRAKEDLNLLTYTSSQLEQDLEITGYPIVTLHVSSSEEDSAFFVYLEDIDESGVVRYITEGMLRGIHRKLSNEPPPYVTTKPYRTFKRADANPLPRNEFVEITFAMLPTSVLFQRGHRIRIAIGGADKDTFARIPKKGEPIFQISRKLPYASNIQLPVVSN